MITGQTNQSDELFGKALAAADFDGDGKDDLAIGAPGQDVGGFDQAGSVHVLYGSFSTFSTAFTKNHPNPAADEQFGYSLAAGDIDGTGYDDLVVGVPLHDLSLAFTNTGVLYTMYSDENGVDGATLEFGTIGLVDPSLAAEQGDQFGYALAVLDEPQTLIEFLYLPVVSK